MFDVSQRQPHNFIRYFLCLGLVNFLVKIVNRSGKEEKFDSKDVKKDLEAAGLPERVAEEVSERVEDRVQDHWTTNQVWQEVNVEMKRLEGEMERAQNNINMRSGQTMESRMGQETDHRMRQDTTTNTNTPSSQTFIPESERERQRESRY